MRNQLFLVLYAQLNIILGFGNHLIPVDLSGIDVVPDDGARELVADALQENVSIKTGAEIAHLHLEIGLVKHHVSLDAGESLAQTFFHIESPVLGGRTRERCHLDAVARNGAHPLIQLYMLLHQLRHRHIALNLHVSLASVAAIQTGALRL